MKKLFCIFFLCLVFIAVMGNSKLLSILEYSEKIALSESTPETRDEYLKKLVSSYLSLDSYEKAYQIIQLISNDIQKDECIGLMIQKYLKTNNPQKAFELMKGISEKSQLDLIEMFITQNYISETEALISNLSSKSNKIAAYNYAGGVLLLEKNNLGLDYLRKGFELINSYKNVSDKVSFLMYYINVLNNTKTGIEGKFIADNLHIFLNQMQNSEESSLKFYASCSLMYYYYNIKNEELYNELKLSTIKQFAQAVETFNKTRRIKEFNDMNNKFIGYLANCNENELLLKICQNAFSEMYSIDLLLSAVNYLGKINNIEECKKILSIVEEKYKNITDPVQAYTISYRLSIFYDYIQDINKTKEYFAKALEDVEKITDKNLMKQNIKERIIEGFDYFDSSESFKKNINLMNDSFKKIESIFASFDEETADEYLTDLIRFYYRVRLPENILQLKKALNGKLKYYINYMAAETFIKLGNIPEALNLLDISPRSTYGLWNIESLNKYYTQEKNIQKFNENMKIYLNLLNTNDDAENKFYGFINIVSWYKTLNKDPDDNIIYLLRNISNNFYQEVSYNDDDGVLEVYNTEKFIKFYIPELIDKNKYIYFTLSMIFSKYDNTSSIELDLSDEREKIGKVTSVTIYTDREKKVFPVSKMRTSVEFVTGYKITDYKKVIENIDLFDIAFSDKVTVEITTNKGKYSYILSDDFKEKAAEMIYRKICSKNAMIKSVKMLNFFNYPEKSIKDGYDTFFKDPLWIHGEKNLVVFTGKFDYKGKEAVFKTIFKLITENYFDKTFYINDKIIPNDEAEKLLSEIFK